MSKKAVSFSYEEIKVGQTARFETVVRKETVKQFAALSGDRNPLHIDSAYARTTQFKQPIAHGMIAGALFSRLIGMELPGTRSLYISQTLTFRLPVIPGKKVRVEGTVLQKSDAFRTLTIRTTVRDAKTKKVLVEGQALVRVLQ